MKSRKTIFQSFNVQIHLDVNFRALEASKKFLFILFSNQALKAFSNERKIGEFIEFLISFFRREKFHKISEDSLNI